MKKKPDGVIVAKRLRLVCGILMAVGIVFIGLGVGLFFAGETSATVVGVIFIIIAIVMLIIAISDFRYPTALVMMNDGKLDFMYRKSNDKIQIEPIDPVKNGGSAFYHSIGDIYSVPLSDIVHVTTDEALKAYSWGKYFGVIGFVASVRSINKLIIFTKTAVINILDVSSLDKMPFKIERLKLEQTGKGFEKNFQEKLPRLKL